MHYAGITNWLLIVFKVATFTLAARVAIRTSTWSIMLGPSSRLSIFIEIDKNSGILLRTSGGLRLGGGNELYTIVSWRGFVANLFSGIAVLYLEVGN